MKIINGITLTAASDLQRFHQYLIDAINLLLLLLQKYFYIIKKRDYQPKLITTLQVVRIQTRKTVVLVRNLNQNNYIFNGFIIPFHYHPSS